MQRLTWLFLLSILFSIPGESKAKELPKIAVWDLEARETKPAYARELTSILVSELSKLGKYEVYSQENVRTLTGWTVERMKLGSTSTQTLTALGQMDIAKLISGSVGKIGNRYSISLNLFDTQNAKAEKAISEFCRTEDELIELAQTAVRKLLGGSVEAAVPERKELDKTFTNSIGMEFLLVSEGRFTMGSPANENGRTPAEGPLHEVQITKSFYMGKYKVRVFEFREFVKATGHKTDAETKGGSWILGKDNKWEKKADLYWENPGFSQKDDHPVTCVSWNDATEYAKWLSKKTGHSYRFPTEAEWEYACRAGSKSAYSFGPDASGLGKYAWYLDNAGLKTHPVGQKRPNPWGLYDMHGNVWEYCQDWYGNYASGFVVDPVGPPSGLTRVQRGGCWGTPARYLRCAERRNSAPSNPSNRTGFRLFRMP